MYKRYLRQLQELQARAQANAKEHGVVGSSQILYDTVAESMLVQLLERARYLNTGRKLTLTPYDMTTIRLSWNSWLAGDSSKRGFELFLRMFKNNPETQRVFEFAKGSSSEQMQSSTRLIFHVTRVIKYITKVVQNLSCLEDIVPLLRALGGRHSETGYNVPPKYFPLLGVALRQLLKENVRNYNKRMDKLWDQVFSWIVEQIQIGQKDNMERSKVKCTNSESQEECDRMAQRMLIQLYERAKYLNSQSQLMLKGSEKIIIRLSWNKWVSGNPSERGFELFLRMFKSRPETKQVFDFARGSSSEQVQSSSKLIFHVTRVVKYITKVVENLDKLEDVVPVLRQLGGRHGECGYRVPANYFPYLGVALRELMKETNPNFKENTDQLWNTLYTWINTQIQTGQVTYGQRQ